MSASYIADIICNPTLFQLILNSSLSSTKADQTSSIDYCLIYSIYSHVPLFFVTLFAPFSVILSLFNSSNAPILVNTKRLYYKFILLLLLTIWCKIKSVVSSGVLTITWLLNLLTLLPELIIWIRLIKINELEIITNENYLLSIYLCQLLCVGQLVMLHCFADTVLVAKDKQITPELQLSFLNRITYMYVTPLLYTGYRRLLTFNDVWLLNDCDRCEVLRNKWIHLYEPALKKYFQKRDQLGKVSDNLAKVSNNIRKVRLPSTFAPLVRIAWRSFFGSLALQPVLIAVKFLQPQILRELIDVVSHNDQLWPGIVLSLALFACVVCDFLVSGQCMHQLLRSSWNAYSCLVSALFDKTMRLSNASKANMSAGTMLSLTAVDAERVMRFFNNIYYLIQSPLMILVAIAMIYQALELSALAGVAVLLLIVPANAFIGYKQRQLQRKQMEYKDARLKKMNEILNGIRVIKLYAWEPSMATSVERIRRCEMRVMRSQFFYGIFQELFFRSAPIFALIASLSAYTLIAGHELTVSKTFFTLALFNMLQTPLNQMPNTLLNAVQTLISFRRVGEFLFADEIDSNTIDGITTEPNVVVEFDHCSLSWDDGESSTLIDITCSIKAGELVAVVGRVAAGKSSFISAIAGEMHRIDGHLRLSDYLQSSGIALVPQEPWIQNKSLRDNIVFGREFDQQRYDRVLQACALVPDLEMLPAGDQTEIGEKGINLSGGQKARVSLARAVYHQQQSNIPSLYLLDDPLSAVDSHVVNHLFDNVIGNSANSLLRDQTRILVTHSLIHLKHVDRIIVIADGKISEIGTYKELITANGCFAQVLKEYLIERIVDSQRNQNQSIDESITTDDVILEQVFDDLKGTDIGNEVAAIQTSRRLSNTSNNRIIETRQLSNHEGVSSKLITTTGKLVEDEKMQIGKVNWKVYALYASKVGIPLAILYCISLFLCTGGFEIGSSFWLANWAEDSGSSRSNNGSSKPAPYSTSIRLGVYGGFGVAQAAFLGLSSFLLAHAAYSASTKLHGALVHSLMRSPMSFFDTTPSGRIINRVSKDMDRVDQQIPNELHTSFSLFRVILIVLIIVMVTTPYLIAVVIPAVFIFGLLYRFYMTSIVQLSRINSRASSFIFSLLADTIAGVKSIRAYRMQHEFSDRMCTLIDDYISVYQLRILCNRWVSIYTSFLSSLIILISTLVTVYLVQYKILSIGLLGLTITYALRLTNVLGELCRQWKEVESDIVAVERIDEYIKHPTEAEWKSTNKPVGWPSTGTIRFENYSLRYRPDTELVLKNVNIQIECGEKIGIVGRTGAGKSSLSIALFRLVEADCGRILIDGKNIADIGLHELREQLMIIPQDPVIFSGTLRANLDPFDRHSDDELWCALECAHLKSIVIESPMRLEQVIAENGSNLSVGRRQLLCLARALLKKTRILVLDEATAAVDVETDANIQSTIREQFADCTILTIAHRLHTIVDYDRILVLDAGCVVEFDTPRQLIDQTNSVFRSMAVQAGIVR